MSRPPAGPRPLDPKGQRDLTSAAQRTQHTKLSSWWLWRSGTARRLAIAALTQSVGIGLFLASSMTFFTREIGVSPKEVGAVLAAAGLVALAASLAGGVLADRYGARRTLVVLHCCRAVCYSGYAFANSLTSFLIVTMLTVTVDRTASPTFQAVVASTVTDARRRTEMLALINVVRNCGLGLGALVAGIVLAAESHVVYRVMLAVVCLAFLGSAATIRGLPVQPVAGKPTPKAVIALPPPRYLLITALNFVLCSFDALLVIAMPMLVLSHRQAEPAVISVMFAANTLLVVVLQIPVSRLSRGSARSGRMMTWAGVMLAATVALFALAERSDEWWATGWLTVAVIVLSMGEVLANSAGWDLSISLAPVAQRAQYLSVFNLGIALQRIVGPIAVTGLLLGSGPAGWIGAGLVFLVAGWSTERIVRAGPVEPVDHAPQQS